jgi:hypothetical protein
MSILTSKSLLRFGALLGILAGAAYGCGGEEHPDPFDADTDSDGNSTGGNGFGNDGPNDGPGPNNGNPTYQPNFIDRGQPPGPPERGYTAVEPELSGSGEGDVCALCADSGDCAAGACVIHMDTGETFCGAECGDDADCPDPQTQECVRAEGASSSQCVPRLGTCYEFDDDAEPINPINRPDPNLGNGEGGEGGAG